MQQESQIRNPNIEARNKSQRQIRNPNIEASPNVRVNKIQELPTALRSLRLISRAFLALFALLNHPSLCVSAFKKPEPPILLHLPSILVILNFGNSNLFRI